MEKVESSIENSLCAQDPLELGFDDVARNKVRVQLNRCSLENSLSAEENDRLMFLLSQSILY